ncbi:MULTISPECIES: BglG family transcription antiterminator LicT [Bacillus]|uniref:BglG family transcription antiterminator LicT n=1 Tax=Bacillus TaxID=1386 RepID=UPI000556C849|nr:MULTISPECIES: PRD domain-containing protein [Bacillus]AKU31078.1 transcription antiterminator LicT [Bacillus altitudinis]QAR52908.1 PRD domain-containing protein [Bacillus aerophilus]QII23266.1 PRD domain-containing protein [Bacillus altitudinis]USY51543.1 PRD domain-containing protein [Bacillus altitudinis]
MQIQKVLNNNVISVIDEQGKEIVVMGRGIAFQRRPGDPVDEALIDKVFRLEDHSVHERMKMLLQEVPYDVVKVTEEMIQYAHTKLNRRLNESLHVSLADHIHYAIERLKKNHLIENSLIWEIKRLYKDEFLVAKECLEMIEDRLDIELPEDEAGFIAMHIINAELNEDMNTTVNITKEVNAILTIVKYHLNMEFDEDSLNFYRFLTHLRFFVQRLINETLLVSEDQDLYQLIKVKYPKAYECAKKIAEYVYQTYHRDLTSEEMLYLSIHLNRLIKREK